MSSTITDSEKPVCAASGCPETITHVCFSCGALLCEKHSTPMQQEASEPVLCPRCVRRSVHIQITHPLDPKTLAALAKMVQAVYEHLEGK